jgi:hypothetical protein
VDLDFGGASHDTLSLQRRSPDGVWSDAVPLVSSADRPGYVCYHQKLTVDRRGRLYLSLSYYNPALYPPKQRRANRFRYRMVLISKDGGASWDFATTLTPGATHPAATAAYAAGSLSAAGRSEAGRLPARAGLRLGRSCESAL